MIKQAGARENMEAKKEVIAQYVIEFVKLHTKIKMLLKQVQAKKPILIPNALEFLTMHGDELQQKISMITGEYKVWKAYLVRGSGSFHH